MALAGGVVILGALALAADALTGSDARTGGDGIPTGWALDDDGGGGILQPLPPDTPLSLGLVHTRNVSVRPVELVGARLLRLDPDLELLGFSALPERPAAGGDPPPITALAHPLPGAVPLAAYPALPPAPDGHPQVAVMFALRVKPGGAGKAVGVEVQYRQDGKLRRQVFRQQVYACSVPTVADADCPGVQDEMDVFGEFEDEVRGISGRRHQG